jgi:hypothetical protein
MLKILFLFLFIKNKNLKYSKHQQVYPIYKKQYYDYHKNNKFT